MKTAAVLSGLALIVASTTPAFAQFETPKTPPDTWVSAWVGGFMNPGRVTDAQSATHWDFGTSLAGGLGIHRNFGRTVSIGLDAGFSPARYEMVPVEGSDATAAEGTARVVTGMLSGRLRYGGGSALFMYLTGGAGALVYGMPELGRWDPDLALLTGAGLEYRLASSRALFVEWGRYWTFHQSEGVADNSTKHGQIRLGVRTGW